MIQRAAAGPAHLAGLSGPTKTLADGHSGNMAIYTLPPSARHVAVRARVFLEAVAARLEGCEL